MRIVRNIGHVKRRKRFARLSALVGFLLLASTFVLVFYPSVIAVAYLLLFGGFVLFNIGMQQLGKWANTPRHPRSDLALDEALKSFGDRYVLIHYARLGKRVVEHQLVHPGGVLVITARDLPGQISGHGSRWRRRGLGMGRLFGLSGPQLGNPALDTDHSIAAIEQALGEGKLEVDVAGSIVFLNPQIQLDLDEPEYPAMKLDDLPNFARSLPVDANLRANDRDGLVALLGKGEELEQTEPRRSRRRPVKVKRRAA